MLFNLQTFWRIFRKFEESRVNFMVALLRFLRRGAEFCGAVFCAPTTLSHKTLKRTSDYYRRNEPSALYLLLVLFCSYNWTRIIHIVYQTILLSSSVARQPGGFCTSKHYKKIRCPGNDTKRSVL